MIEDPNEITLSVYNQQTAEYIIKTPPDHNSPSHQWLKRWIGVVLSHVRQQGKILEIGSATPRDARYIRGYGFSVQCSDAAEGFLRYLADEGERPLRINVFKDRIQEKYDLIFTNAALPHLTDWQLQLALDNMHQALNRDGIIAFNVKEGDGEAWINEKFKEERYINYWQVPSIRRVVEEHKFHIISIDSKIRGDLPTHLWIHIIARKIED